MSSPANAVVLPVPFMARGRTVASTGSMRYKGLPVKGRKVPTTGKRTVEPWRSTNAAVRPRDLTGDEIKRLIETARAQPAHVAVPIKDLLCRQASAFG